VAFALGVAMLSAVAAAQAYAPIVTMVVTMPDGRTRELAAAESGLGLRRTTVRRMDSVRRLRTVHHGIELS